MTALIDGACILRERFLNNIFPSLSEEGILASQFQRENELGLRGSVFLAMYSTDNSKCEKAHLPGHSLMCESLGKHLDWRKKVEMEGR